MRSVRNVAHPEDLPELGTPEAAVESCVSLIAGMTGQPEKIVHYWLDLYFQVRLVYEREAAKEPEASPALGLAVSDAPAAEPGPGPDTREDPPQTPSAQQDVVMPGFTRRPGAQTGNTYALAAAEFKRETSARLIRMREAGLTTATIVEHSDGKLQDTTIWDILNAKRVPIESYRILAAVLDKIEADG